jgi:hypothetical protein
MRIVGLTGTRGSGKDAVASFMTMLHGYTRVAFADRLKEAASLVYGLSHEQVHGSLAAKEEVDPRWGLSPRFILQQLGTEVGRSIHPDTWIRSLLDVDIPARESAGASPTGWVVADVRFPNEAAAIRERGGCIVRVVRPGWDLGGAAAQHASEVELAAIAEDFVIENSGTLEDLGNQTQLLIRKLKENPRGMVTRH